MSGEPAGKRWKRAVFACVAIVIFFSIAELGLWALGVRPLLSDRDPFQGFSRHVPVFEPDADRDVYRTPRRAVLHSFNYQEFARVKPDNALRIFVAGGSSTFGFPWGAEVAFPKLLGAALHADLPDVDVEAVNAGAMSYGSNRLRILVAELLHYEPDIIVIYGGHNEFVERYFYRDLLGRRSGLDRAKRILNRSRVYSLMTRGYERLVSAEPPATGGSPGPDDLGGLLGLDVDRESAVDVGSDEQERVRQQFEDNLRAIADETSRAGVPLVLCTVPSNVAGWLPNQSIFDRERSLDDRAEVRRLLVAANDERERGRPAESLVALEQARERAPEYAEVWFRLGQANAALERWDEARVAFVRARDLDAQPARATTRFNDTLRAIAAERQIPLVDVEREFEKVSPHGLLGFNLFEDYVHPNIQGHRWIAYEVWRTLHEAGLVGSRVSVDLADFVESTDIDPRDPVDEQTAAEIAASTGRGPDLLYNLAVVLENRGLTNEAIDKYRACLRLRPQYYIARENMAHLLFGQGRFVAAARKYAEVLETRSDRVESLVGLGESLRRTGGLDEAIRALGMATEVDPSSVDAWNSLGGALAQAGRQSDAEAAFRHALTLEPESAAAYVNLGLSLLFQDRLDDADAAFRSALTKDPQNIRARDGLAAVLTERGRLDEAERIFRENLTLDPDDEFATGGLRLIGERRGKLTGPDDRGDDDRR